MINKSSYTNYRQRTWHNDPSGRIIVVSAFSLVVLGLVGCVGIACWCMEGMMGVLGLAWGSWGWWLWHHKVFLCWCWGFALWALSWVWDIFCVSFMLWCLFSFAGLHAWGLLMEVWATLVLMLDSNQEFINHMQSSLLSNGTWYDKWFDTLFLQLTMILRGGPLLD